MFKSIKLAWLIGAVFLLTSCATGRSSYYKNGLSQFLESGKIDQAILTAEEKLAKDQPKDRVVDLLNLASLRHFKQDYLRSSALLEEAKQLSDHYEKISIQEVAKSLIVNDYDTSYVAPHFERYLIHFLSALNYIARDDWSGARVEIRQADVYFRHTQEPSVLLFYLGGIVFEYFNSFDQALVFYRRAYEQAKAMKEADSPALIEENLLIDYVRMLLRLNHGSELKKVEKDYPKLDLTNIKTLDRSLVVVRFDQLASKREEFREWMWYLPADDFIFIRLPMYPKQKLIPSQNQVMINDQIIDSSALVMSVEHQARLDLDKKMPLIVTKTLARTWAWKVSSDALLRQADDTDNLFFSVAGIGLKMANAVGASADLRSWQVLPAFISISRMPRPNDSETINISFNGQSLKTFSIKDAPMQLIEGNF